MINTKLSNGFLGRQITVDNGVIEFTATLDVGPRIISLRPINGLNIMYNDEGDYVNKDCSSVYGAGKKWHIYGGHRLWLSPEEMSTYYPDNDPVRYELTENGIILTPPLWKVVEVQPCIKIEFIGKNDIQVTHTVTNFGEKKKLCLWALTVMKCGGKMTFELSKEDTGLLANRNVVMWSYASMKDSRVTIDDDRIVLKSDTKVPNAYKIGAYKRDAKAVYEYAEDGRQVTFRKEVQGVDGAEYPDFTCNFESYCSDKIHEIETLSSMQIVDKNAKIEHIEKWHIC